MELSLKQAKYISVTLIGICILSASAIPWISFFIANDPLKKSNHSLSLVSKSVNIIKHLNEAESSFDQMIKGRTNIIESINSEIDKSIELSTIIYETSLDNQTKNKAELFIKNLKQFKTSIYYYHKEITYDPTSDTADQIENHALMIKNKTIEALSEFISDLTKKSGTRLDNISSILSKHRNITVYGLLFSLGLGILCLLIVSKALESPLKKLIEGTQLIAEGQITTQVDITDKSIVGDLAQSFNLMVKKIKEEQEKRQAIVDSMPFMLVCTDAMGNMKLSNRTTALTIGFTQSNMTNKKIWEVIPKFEPEKEKFLQIVKDGTQFVYKKYPVNWKNSQFLFDVTIYPLDLGAEFWAVVLMQDVTKSAKMEEMMIQSEKMLSVGGLAAGMAHEINNPLAGIMQNAQVIKNRLTKSLPANDKAALESKITIEAMKNYMEKRKILTLLDHIVDAGGNASKIVDNMLSFSKKGKTAKGKYNIIEMLEKTIDLAQNDYDLKKKYDFKQVEVIKEFDSDMPVAICDESKIMQVFFNIIKNATESLYDAEEKAERSKLIFRVRSIENMVQTEIEDNGSGMDENVRKRVFEPFFTTKDTDRGTGLGLSLSYFIIVDDHNGEMEVESFPGKGTKFIIKLPIE